MKNASSKNVDINVIEIFSQFLLDDVSKWKQWRGIWEKEILQVYFPWTIAIHVKDFLTIQGIWGLQSAVQRTGEYYTIYHGDPDDYQFSMDVCGWENKTTSLIDLSPYFPSWLNDEFIEPGAEELAAYSDNIITANVHLTYLKTYFKTAESPPWMDPDVIKVLSQGARGRAEITQKRDRRIVELKKIYPDASYLTLLYKYQVKYPDDPTISEQVIRNRCRELKNKVEFAEIFARGDRGRLVK